MRITLRKTKNVVSISERDAYLAKYAWHWSHVLGVIRYDAQGYDPDTQRTPTVIMARVITNALPGWYVTHLDGDRLNNQRSNLLLLNAAQNAQYTRKKLPRSGYRGVTRKGHNFVVTVGGKYVGRFDDPEDAARAYDEEALAIYGAHARINFPRQFLVCHECNRAHFALVSETTCVKCVK